MLRNLGLKLGGHAPESPIIEQGLEEHLISVSLHENYDLL